MTLTDTGTADPYPTRVAGDPELRERIEPTVWTTGAVGPIDPATLAAHDSRGYSIHHDLLSPPEVQAYCQELDRLAASATAEGVITEDGQVRTIFGVHRLSPLVAELVRDPRVLDRARQIVGSEVYVHQSRATYLAAFEGRGHYWHSDFETWHAEDGLPRMRAVSVSIALTENHDTNGGLMIMPGSHNTFLGCSGATPKDNYKKSLQMQDAGTPSDEALTKFASKHGIKLFTGKAGSATWFDCNCMHGSGDNITPFPRSNVFIVFNSVENTAVEPFSAPVRRPEFIGARDFTPVK